MHSTRSTSREVGLHSLERRVRVEGQPRPQAQAADLGDELVRVPDLDVDRAPVRAGVGEILQIAAGLGHHEVAVEEQRRMPSERRDHWWPDRHVRDEVPVHDVDVQPVGYGGHLPHLLGQHAEVGGEHRRRDAQVADPTGVALRSCCPMPHPSAAVQLKRAQQRIRRNP